MTKVLSYNYNKISGYEAALTRAINLCEDGAYVTLDIKTAITLRTLLRGYKEELKKKSEIYDQALSNTNNWPKEPAL